MTTDYSICMEHGVVTIVINAKFFSMKKYLEDLRRTVGASQPTKMIIRLNKIPLKPALMLQQEECLPDIRWCAIVVPRANKAWEKIFRGMAQRKPHVKMAMFSDDTQVAHFLETAK